MNCFYLENLYLTQSHRAKCQDMIAGRDPTVKLAVDVCARLSSRDIRYPRADPKSETPSILLYGAVLSRHLLVPIELLCMMLVSAVACRWERFGMDVSRWNPPKHLLRPWFHDAAGDSSHRLALMPAILIRYQLMAAMREGSFYAVMTRLPFRVPAVVGLLLGGYSRAI